MVAAIQDFCGGKISSNDLYVPSSYASTGAQNGSAKVFLTGFCNPAEWVPVQYCYSQFLDLCISDQIYAVYGLCQQFNIQVDGN